jgi:uncharacterized membrane protein YphA (DoxX/SURF4 family)
MTKFLSRYPDGVAGIGLAFLRFCCALIVFPALAQLPLPGFVSDLGTVFAAVLALALVTGVGTRLVAFALACVTVADAFAASSDWRLAMVAHTGGYVALVLLGPGAYSVDANVFGRRVVRLDPRSPDRGSGD